MGSTSSIKKAKILIISKYQQYVNHQTIKYHLVYLVYNAVEYNPVRTALRGPLQ